MPHRAATALSAVCPVVQCHTELQLHFLQRVKLCPVVQCHTALLAVCWVLLSCAMCVNTVTALQSSVGHAGAMHYIWKTLELYSPLPLCSPTQHSADNIAQFLLHVGLPYQRKCYLPGHWASGTSLASPFLASYSHPKYRTQNIVIAC
jgi:hypothetical protein